MLYCIFCYKEDEPLLALCAQRVKEVDPAAVIYAISDAAAPVRKVPEGVQLRETSFPRGGSLNGLLCVAGMLSVFRELMEAEGAGYVVKLDADTWVNALPGWEADDGVGYLGFERWQVFQPAGHCYRLSRAAVERMCALFEERTRAGLWPPNALYREDHTIYGLATAAHMPQSLIPFMEGRSTGMADALPGEYEACRAAWVVHCGEHCGYDAKGQVIRPTRGHVLMRMAVLKYELRSTNYPASSQP